MYVDIMYYHTLREVDRNTNIVIVILSLSLSLSATFAIIVDVCEIYSVYRSLNGTKCTVKMSAILLGVDRPTVIFTHSVYYICCILM